MKNAVIVHGMCDKDEYYSPQHPSASNSHWLPWLQNQLLIRDIPAVTPEMPHNYEPDYSVWRREFERFDITPETILVGHSCGGGFLVRWLSENKTQTVSKVVLVAPWLDPRKIKSNASNFFDFSIDKELAARTQGVTVFSSDDDFDDIQISVQQIIDTITDVELVEFQKKGHFCFEDLDGEEFPELLEKILLR